MRMSTVRVIEATLGMVQIALLLNIVTPKYDIFDISYLDNFGAPYNSETLRRLYRIAKIG